MKSILEPDWEATLDELAPGSSQGAQSSASHPPEAPDKGEALEELLTRTGRARALYVGDDRTDEDAFRAPRVSLAVRVGRTGRTSAHAYLPSQEAIDELLRRLARARRRAQGLAGDTSGLERLLAMR